MTVHHFSVDVEEYFHVSAFEPFVRYDAWTGFESRVSGSVTRLLELLARFQSRATFFMLGWLADRQPALVHRIAAAGHEIASHGWDHARVTEQTPVAFRDSIRRTKIVLEELAGVLDVALQVVGHDRALARLARRRLATLERALHPVGDPDLLVAVHLVAVLDSVDKSFFEGELDTEYFTLAIVMLAELILESVLDRGHFRTIARQNHMIGKIRGGVV